MGINAMDMLDPVLKKYNVPVWMKPYLYEYIKQDPINALKRATSFIDVKRKKGVVTGDFVKLPNNTTFKTSSIVHILSLFYYGEEESAKIAKEWSSKPDPPNKVYVDQFASMVDTYEKRQRAIKNLLEGMGYKPATPTAEAVSVFSYMRTLNAWPERAVAACLLLKQAYGTTFGTAFYRAFYYVMPEFMRSFGKAFDGTGEATMRGEELAKEVVRSKSVPDDRLVKITEDVLSRIARSINAEMHLADHAGIRKEAELLRRIAVLYPLHSLGELGVPIDVDAEEKRIAAIASKPA